MDNPREFFAKQRLEQSDYLKTYNAGKPAKTYIKAREFEAAFKYVLETGCRADKTLTYLAECFESNDEWIANVKRNRVHPDIVKRTFKTFDKHYVITGMKQAGILCVSNKRGIKSAQSLSAFLNGLADNVKLYNEFTQMQIELQVLRQALEELMDD